MLLHVDPCALPGMTDDLTPREADALGILLHPVTYGAEGPVVAADEFSRWLHACHRDDPNGMFGAAWVEYRTDGAVMVWQTDAGDPVEYPAGEAGLFELGGCEWVRVTP